MAKNKLWLVCASQAGELEKVLRKEGAIITQTQLKVRLLQTNFGLAKQVVALSSCATDVFLTLADRLGGEWAIEKLVAADEKVVLGEGMDLQGDEVVILPDAVEKSMPVEILYWQLGSQVRKTVNVQVPRALMDDLRAKAALMSSPPNELVALAIASFLEEPELKRVLAAWVKYQEARLEVLGTPMAAPGTEGKTGRKEDAMNDSP